jgi:hypothetical protein
MPVSRAIPLRNQCVAPADFDCVVRVITPALRSGEIAGVRPGRGASFIKPATLNSINRLRPRAAMRGATPSRSGISLFWIPSAAAKTIRLGCTTQESRAPTR